MDWLRTLAVIAVGGGVAAVAGCDIEAEPAVDGQEELASTFDDEAFDYESCEFVSSCVGDECIVDDNTRQYVDALHALVAQYELSDRVRVAEAETNPNGSFSAHLEWQVDWVRGRKVLWLSHELQLRREPLEARPRGCQFGR